PPPPLRPTRFPYTTLFRSRAGGRLERVAHAVHRADEVRAELAAQCLDVRVDGAGAAGVRPVPDLGEQALAREHGLGGAREHHEEDRKSTRLNSSHVKISYA